MYHFYTKKEIEKIQEAMKNMVKPEYGIVVDLETLGKGPDTVVLNLAGHVFSFDPRKMSAIPLEGLDIYKNYRFGVSPQTTIGRNIDDDTFEWWASKDRRAAMEAIMNLPKVDFYKGIGEFYEWIKALKTKLKCRVYYRGQDFDYPIVQSLFKSTNIDVTFIRGDAPRDTRSYIDGKIDGLSGYLPGNSPSTELHTALGDCINDIRQIQYTWLITNGIDPLTIITE